MKKIFIFCLILTTFITTLIGCGGGNSNQHHSSTLPNIAPAGVYMSGQKIGSLSSSKLSAQNGDGIHGCIWINGQLYDMGAVLVKDVKVVNDKIYACGTYLYHDISNPEDPHDDDRCCYWVGNEKFDLPVTGSPAEANRIWIDGTDIYIVGQDNGKPCYWKNNQVHLLPTASGEGGGAVDICIQNGTIYCAGYRCPSSIMGCYWINDERHDLAGTTAWANGIFINGTDVYVMGDSDGPSHYSEACYWVNGNRNILSVPNLSATQVSEATDVFIYNNVIYVAGWCNGNSPGNNDMKLCYWEDGVRTDFLTRTFDQRRMVYISADDTNVYTACEGLSAYWENGNQILIGNTGGYEVSSISINE